MLTIVTYHSVVTRIKCRFRTVEDGFTYVKKQNLLAEQSQHNAYYDEH